MTMKNKSGAHTISRYIVYDSEKNLDFILDGHVERAIEVAYASEQSLLIIGGKNTQAKEISDSLNKKSLTIPLLHNRQIMYWTPCPCGFYKHPTIPCTCSVKELKEHLKEKPIADMEVSISIPIWDDVKKRIEYDLSEASLSLLKTAYERLNTGYGGILNIIARAKTIAEMDKEENIKLHHIAESIQYYPSDNAH